MTLEMKSRMRKFSLLYANIAPKWNTMISRETQVHMIPGVDKICREVNVASVNGAGDLGVWRCSETPARILVSRAP